MILMHLIRFQLKSKIVHSIHDGSFDAVSCCVSDLQKLVLI